MKKVISGFKAFAEQYRYVLAILAIMGGSASLAFGTTIWYYGQLVEDKEEAYRELIRWYQLEVDAEREVNRLILNALRRDVDIIVSRIIKSVDNAEAAASHAEDAAQEAKEAIADTHKPPPP